MPTPNPNTTKRCTKCRLIRALTDFYRRLDRNAEFSSQCKGCMKAFSKKHRRKWRLASYGLTLSEYAALVTAQRGRCAICGRRPKQRDRDAHGLHVDHNHKTDAVRALLCFTCNTLLGLGQDDPELLRTAAAYLEEHN